MDRNVELAIKITSDATDAATTFDRTGAAALAMGDDIEAASRQARTAAERIDSAAEASDTLASKSSQATGALGALSSGFELVGAEKYAGTLQAAALATDFFSGVGDALNLVMNSTIITTAKAKAAAIANTVVTGAQTAATTAMTAAQAALNAVMAANPILLVVLAVTALVAALVLAYKKSETFRRIVDASFRAIQAAAKFAFDWIKKNWRLLLVIITGPIGLAVALVTKHWNKITAGAAAVVSWIKRNWKTLLAIITGPIGLAVLAISKNWDKITAGFQRVRDIISRVVGTIRDAIRTGFDLALAPIQAVIDAIQKVIDLIKSIPKPDLDFDVPFFRSSTPTTQTGAVRNDTTVINLNGVLDTGSGVDQLLRILNDRARRVGGQVVIV